MALTKSLSFSMGRKRVLISNNSCNLDHFTADFDDGQFAPVKQRRCGQEINFSYGDLFNIYNNENNNNASEEAFSLLEALPQEILIKVVCGVEHEDLKQLFHVSKTVRDATIVAKKTHFAYSTPTKTKGYWVGKPLDGSLELEAPNAPRQARRNNRPRINKKRLGDIAVSLFSTEEAAEEEEERWPRKSLFMDIDD